MFVVNQAPRGQNVHKARWCKTAQWMRCASFYCSCSGQRNVFKGMFEADKEVVFNVDRLWGSLPSYKFCYRLLETFVLMLSS